MLLVAFTGDLSLTQKEREERIKQLKEKQNEERQRKLEELKAQAMATQKFREQKEEERRRRIDDLKCRDSEKRNQVEERKRAIWEAEKERREYILRKNQERDQRMETKRKNERSQIAFAFGSSTPRMLDAENQSIWAHRRYKTFANNDILDLCYVIIIMLTNVAYCVLGQIPFKMLPTIPAHPSLDAALNVKWVIVRQRNEPSQPVDWTGIVMVSVVCLFH